MKNFYHKLLIHRTTCIPSTIEEQFRHIFHDPKNVEWSKIDDNYEALFYDGNHEKIARFDHLGKLIETRTNLKPQEFPAPENHPVRQTGIIMNYIKIQSGNKLSHDLIIKKPDLKRIHVLLDEHLKIIREVPL